MRLLWVLLIHIINLINSRGSIQKLNSEIVVGSLTTTPARLFAKEGHLSETLLRLLSITILDKIYLNVPWSYGIRINSGNVTISESILKIAESSKGRLRILRSEDYGPATKLLPILLLTEDELPSNSSIITFDDDRLYTVEAVEALVHEGFNRPNSVITIAAWPIHILSSQGRRGMPNGPNFHSSIPKGKEGVQYIKSGPVDLILGFFGVLYRKKFFIETINENMSLSNKSLFNYNISSRCLKHCLWVDDIWFSGHLERLNIPRYVIGNVPNTKANITPLSNVHALSLDEGISTKQNRDNVLCADAMRKEFNIWGNSKNNNHVRHRVQGD